jgi:hypothetical protein
MRSVAIVCLLAAAAHADPARYRDLPPAAQARLGGAWLLDHVRDEFITAEIELPRALAERRLRGYPGILVTGHDEGIDDGEPFCVLFIDVANARALLRLALDPTVRRFTALPATGE